MANPPISIPPFANVPAPGSPIKSDWPQQITQYVVDIQARIAGGSSFAATANVSAPNAAPGAAIPGMVANFTTRAYPRLVVAVCSSRSPASPVGPPPTSPGSLIGPGRRLVIDRSSSTG